MALDLERSSGRTPAEPERDQAPERTGKPFWKRPWILPLAIAVVFYIYSAGNPVLSVPEAEAPLPPHDNFPAYMPLLILHMAGGTLAMLTMVLQVWPWLRQRHPKWHRVSGRLYILGTMVATTLGMIIVWWAPIPGKVGAICLLLFWFVTTVAAYRAVRRGDYAKHRQYMLYSFAVAANNMWAFFVLLILQALKVPMDIAYYEEAARWIPWVGNVFLVQWWLFRTADRPAPVPSAELTHA